jgi:hypothetical protein
MIVGSILLHQGKRKKISVGEKVINQLAAETTVICSRIISKQKFL